MTLNELARKILRDSDCDEYTYGGSESENILKDLMSVYDPGDLRPFTYIEVANEILSFSHPRPIERKPFRVAYDTENDCDAIDCDTFEDAKDTLWSTYTGWMDAERMDWNGEPTPQQKKDWDFMLYNSAAVVQKYDPDIDEYEDYWYPSDEELASWGWTEEGYDFCNQEE